MKLSLLYLATCALSQDDETPDEYVRETANGHVRGFSFDASLNSSEIFLPEKVEPGVLKNEEYHTEIYLGIPYAKPPVGDLRWKPTKPFTGKLTDDSTPYDATYTRNSCKKTDFSRTYGEDCLFLNVFVPKRAVQDNRTVAVAVWLHGGGFEDGSGGVLIYDGRFWADESDMVLVTINYRLGPFGFLSWNHLEPGEETVGNYGLMDQEMAFQWVKDNIANFNGDPNKVQVFGQSAGGMSIGCHLLREKDRPVEKKLFTSAVLHSVPYHIAFKENWEAGIQASHFARELGCPTMDKVCMRNKSYDEVMDAKGRTNSIVNKDKLFLAAVQWGPTIDGKYLKQQPFEALRNGDYDTTKNIMTGMTTHESEIFVRGVFGQPMNDFGMVGGCRALFQGLENGKELLTQIFQGYNMAYDGDGEFPEMSFPVCNSTVGDWSPVLSLPGADAGHIPEFMLPKYSNISDSTRGPWDGMLTADDEVTNENCKERCEESFPDSETLCSSICSKVSICDASVIDERNTLEIPATDLTFLCPERQWVMKNAEDGILKEKNIYVYQFANIMPADIRKIGGGSGFGSYARCFDEVSCHAADLTYIFDTARRVDCSDERLRDDVFIYCDKETGRIYPEDQEFMARSMKRYWANFARNGDPNDDTGAFYPDYVYGEDCEKTGKGRPGNLPDNRCMEKLEYWDPFKENNGRLMIQNDDVIAAHKGNKIEMHNNYMEPICNMWDEVDVYLKI